MGELEWDGEDDSDAEPAIVGGLDEASVIPAIMDMDYAVMQPAPGTPAAVVHADAEAPPVKRRRINVKSSPAGTGYPVAAPVVLPRRSSGDGEVWRRELKNQLGVYWGKRLSSIFGERIVAPWLSRNAVGVSLRDVDFKSMFDAMSEESQKRWLQSLLPGHEKPPDSELEFLSTTMQIRSVDTRAAAAKFGAAQPWVTCGALLTWNGDFGFFRHEAVRDIWMNLTMTPDEKVEALRGVPDVMDVFIEFDRFISEKYVDAGFEKYSVCLEASFQSLDVGRVHFHAAVSHMRQSWQLKQNMAPDKWIFKGAKPFVKKNSCLKPKMATMLINNMHFYVQAKKIGHVIHETNYYTCKDFKQEAKWVMEMWYVQKISAQAAIDSLYEGRNRIRCSVEEIERFTRREEIKKLSLAKEAVDMKIASLQAPWIMPDLVLQWRDQWRVDANGACVNHGVLSRFKFLVLHGPSRTGKTSFAKSLWGTEKSFVPCQGVDEPNMHEFDRKRHSAVIFDECSSKVVLGSKALFQANNDFQKLGQSQCNQHCYTVWMYAVPMIVCTNTWLSDIPTSDVEGREWLQSNSIYLRVDDPMYQSVN